MTGRALIKVGQAGPSIGMDKADLGIPVAALQYRLCRRHAVAVPGQHACRALTSPQMR
jgi:hypothetical protein